MNLDFRKTVQAPGAQAPRIDSLAHHPADLFAGLLARRRPY